jgi:hypothetical protein
LKPLPAIKKFLNHQKTTQEFSSLGLEAETEQTKTGTSVQKIGTGGGETNQQIPDRPQSESAH